MLGKLIYAGVAVAVAVTLAWLYGLARYEEGWAEATARQAQAAQEMAQRLGRMRAQSRERLATAEAALKAREEEYHAAVERLEKRDAEARAWMAGRLPPAVARLIWVPDASRGDRLPDR